MLLQRFLDRAIAAFALCLILLAPLAPVPASAAQADVAVEKAIAWLHTQQLPGGGFGFRQPSGIATPDAKTTADVIYALALAGEEPAGPSWRLNGETPLDALMEMAADYVGTDAGQAGKVARAVSLAGGNPRDFAGMDLIAIIQAAYDPATGRYHPSFLFRHSLAVEALLRAGETVPMSAIVALKAAQLPDGGWFWSFGAPASDVDTTGRVLHLMAGLAEQTCVAGYKAATRFLANGQRNEGGWGVYPLPNPNPANGNSTGLAIAGLRAAGVDPSLAPFVRSGKSAWEAFLAFQEASGAFVYINEPGKEEVRVMATVDALVALTQPLSASQDCPAVYLPILLAR